ncbi:4-hydroxy-3-methylbut-2-enyl diphosphate reductase [Hathewaya proteolytica DSM 3090]|uniref:4-hydroxy-3-methylbut-2-enyl diphosphate reductase n=1 Tax=Hathewaya proteolytica DSM 3090 TaxID=1121331 RepID=A0A1M6J3R7_9CLOT|nr:bifunctional 4-hydroxy-3-methylbut-2-enyl diphosphate reductase/30S ribosomal protein S1 [Hathewaya proteolytica]SHJ41370.1 4-hydroxy-3-methylbut-2-enyl diphosphate reductase [Hathewaya proteolytica DSM 3090]
MKEVILAKEAGFCFGVKRAVNIALQCINNNNGNIYTLGPLIHNGDVVQRLKEKNIVSIDISQIDNCSKDDIVIIRSHGITPKIMHKLIKSGVQIIDATCPYVVKIQKKVELYHKEGYNIIIVGDSEHPEVQGINGFCGDSALITKDGSEIDTFNGRVCIVSQTTEKVENYNKVVEKVKSLNIDHMAINTICKATSLRQKSAYDISKQVDAMIVIGGKNSSNTNKLFEICKKNCEKTIHIENYLEIPDWLKSDNIKKIGITAGASTPSWAIEEVITKMQNFNEQDNLMNEQLKYMDENHLDIKTGKIIKGEIISVQKKEAFIDLNYKSDGVLPLSEVTSDSDADLTTIFNIGDIITCKVIKLKDSHGNVVLSTKELERQEGYETLKSASENKTKINVLVKEEVKGGFICNFKGIKLFMPASLAKLNIYDDVKELIGQNVDVYIEEYKKVRNDTKIIVSRKAVLLEEKNQIVEKAWQHIKPNTVVEGVVRRINDFGAFVDVNGIDGLLHISELSWSKVNSVKSVLKVGDKIQVYVLDCNKETNKLSLSLKKLIDNPWAKIEEKYPIGSIVLGKVIRFASFGAFVELEPGVEALLHISQISHNRVEKVENALTINESIKVKVMDVNKEKKRISISTKELLDI